MEPCIFSNVRRDEEHVRAIWNRLTFEDDDCEIIRLQNVEPCRVFIRVTDKLAIEAPILIASGFDNLPG